MANNKQIWPGWEIGNSLAVQWLGFWAFTAGSPSWIVGGGTNIPQVMQHNPPPKKTHLDLGMSEQKKRVRVKRTIKRSATFSNGVWLLWPQGFLCQGIIQARVLERVAISFFRGSSRPRSPALQAESLQTELWRKQWWATLYKPIFSLRTTRKFEQKQHVRRY